jgi:hypothetical protein
MDADDLRDYRDQHPSIHPTSSADLGTYARFLQGMPDFSDMTQEVFTRAVDALLLPSSGPPPPDISIHESIQASYTQQYTNTTSDIKHEIVPWHPISYPISCTISHRLIAWPFAALLIFEISVYDLCQVKEKSIRLNNLCLSFGCSLRI